MKDLNHNKLARYINTMAVHTSITIDPTQISVRIKNKLLKWLSVGAVDGGYRSDARKIGEMLMHSFDLPITLAAWRGVGVRVNRPDVAEKIIELLRADWTAYKLEHGYGDQGYYFKRFQEAAEELRQCAGDNVYLLVHHKQFVYSIRQLIAEHMTTDDRERIAQAMAALQGTEPIHIVNYN